MAAVTVLKFDTESGAENAFSLVQNLVDQKLLTLHDAAIVTWPKGKEKPKTEQLTNLAGTGALDDTFWGILFGFIFFAPLLGMGAGAAKGSLSGSFADVGIDVNFIKSVRKEVTEGTSALFLITSGMVLDSVPEAMKDVEFELISSNLSREQDARLKAAFVYE